MMTTLDYRFSARALCLLVGIVMLHGGVDAMGDSMPSSSSIPADVQVLVAGWKDNLARVGAFSGHITTRFESPSPHISRSLPINKLPMS